MALTRNTLIAHLERLELLLPSVKEYNDLRKILGAEFEGVSDMKLGRFRITGKEVNRSEYTVPAGTYWKWDAVSID